MTINLRFVSSIFLLFLVSSVVCGRHVLAINIDNNIMKLRYSTQQNKYIISLSGYDIENSYKKCALQYYGHENAPIDTISICSDITGATMDATSNMCIFVCKRVELKPSGQELKAVKFLKWCQVTNNNNNNVKMCANKKTFRIKDLYLKSVIKVTKQDNTFNVTVKTKVNRGLSVKEDSIVKSTHSLDEGFYTEKSITLHTKSYKSNYFVEFLDRSSEILLNPHKPDVDWFIATGSKSNNHYTIILQNPNPSQLCYFGIKDINEVHFSSNCSDMKKAGPCFQPCYRATLFHDSVLNYAQVLVKPHGKIMSKEFIQIVTFNAANQPTVTSTGKNGATVNLTSLNKNEDDSGVATGAEIKEIKLIEKYHGVESSGKDLTCTENCKTFEKITISSLEPLTEYILKIKITGLKTVDSPEVKYYHRYIYFKTIGEEFTGVGSNLIPIVGTAEPTTLSLNLNSLFSSGGDNGKTCELYYSIVDSETSKFPATCKDNDVKKFCSGICSENFKIINLDPKTNYQITVCSKGYTCIKTATKETGGVEFTLDTTNIETDKKTKITMTKSAGENGSFGEFWGFVLLEETSKRIITDCLNGECNPTINIGSGTITLELSWTNLNADVKYKVVLINKDKAKPKETSFEFDTEKNSQGMILYYGKSATEYKVKFNDGQLSKTDVQCTIKKSNDDLTAYEELGGNSGMPPKKCNELSTEFDIEIDIQNKFKYISVTYPDPKSVIVLNLVKYAVTGNFSSLLRLFRSNFDESKSTPQRSPPENIQILQKLNSQPTTFNSGKVYSYYMDVYEEITHTAKLDGDKIKLSLDKCPSSCKAYKDGYEETGISEACDGASSTFKSYSIPFDELVKDYYISCPEYFDFHYFYDNTFVKNHASVFSRFYYELNNNDENNALTVRLVNEEPFEMCTFEWIDATASSSHNFFSNVCENKNNYFYSICSSYKFGNLPTTVKAVKIRVLKLGMKPSIGYQNNIYLLEQGSDISVTSSGTKFKINISRNNKGIGGNAVSSASGVQCTLKFWNAYAPLVMENGRKSVSNTSPCVFGEMDITSISNHLPNDIMVSITNIPDYSLRKYFYHKANQNNELTSENIQFIPTASGFTINQNTFSATVTCTIYVRELNKLFYPAICLGNKPCVKTCNSGFTIIDLYSDATYDLKIVPTGAYNIKTVPNIKTSGTTIQFVVSDKSKKNNLIIQPTSSFEDACSTNCYYQLYKHGADQDSPTKIVMSCIGCTGNENIKKCNEIQFDDKIYDNKYNYTLLVYAHEKSKPVKLSIPAFSRNGKLEQKFISSVANNVERFSIKLSEFPQGNKCVIKISSFTTPRVFKKPTSCKELSGNDCLVDCSQNDLEVGYINSKMDRYLLVCYGKNEGEAKACKKTQVFPLIMNFNQKNTYSISHADGNITFSYKTNSISDWKVEYDGKHDKRSDTFKNELALTTYTDTTETKSATFLIDRSMDYYKISSTLLWPGLFYFLNNSYLYDNTPLRSQIIYSISKDNSENKIKIKFSPGPYNDDICHIKVFEVDSAGTEIQDKILNGCKDREKECFQLCQDGIIHLTEVKDKVGVIVKRRFDADGFTQYYKRGDSDIDIDVRDITSIGVAVHGLNVYKKINGERADITCTIKVYRANLFSTETKAQCRSNGECNTDCEDSYSIINLEEGTNYIISVSINNLGINGYTKKLTFRTTGGKTIGEDSSTPIIKGGNATITSFPADDSLPYCRIFLKKNGTSDPKYMATCDEIGACEQKCDSKFKIINLVLGATYEMTVEPSDGRKVRKYTIETKNTDITITPTLNGDSALKVEVTWDGKAGGSRCPFFLQEKTDTDGEGRTVTWCNDDVECSANNCNINIDMLSREKDYILMLKVKDYSLYNKKIIRYSEMAQTTRKLTPKNLKSNIFIGGQNVRSEYTNIEIDDITQKIKIVEEGLYSMIPIVASIFVAIGLFVHRRNSKETTVDL